MTNIIIVGDLYTRRNNNSMGTIPKKIKKEKIKKI